MVAVRHRTTADWLRVFRGGDQSALHFCELFQRVKLSVAPERLGVKNYED